MVHATAAEGPVRRTAQSLRIVVTAELAALLRQGGLRRALVVSAAGGLLVGCAVVAIITYLSSEDPQGPTAVNVTAPIEASIWTSALLFVLGVVMFFGRAAQNGAFAGSLLVVPNRRRLLGAKAVATAVTAACLTAGTSLAVMTVATVAVGSLDWLPQAVLAVACGALAGAALAVIGLLVSVIANRAVAGILACMTWWIVLPLALGVAAAAVPGVLAPVAEGLLRITPSTLLVNATTVSSLSTTGGAALVEGIVGLVAWAALFGWATAFILGRRSL